MPLSVALSSASPPAAPSEDEAPAYGRALNPAQRSAMEALDGPVLVLAGAGTGKTRVLVTRLAHLIATGKATPGQILAVTFTNKAAGEIRERVQKLLGRPVDGWYLGTFHALAARLLRPHAERVGLTSRFTILDADDQLRLMKQILTEANLDEKAAPPRAVLATVERWKDKGLRPEDTLRDRTRLAGGRVPEMYATYQERLRALNACDFGDLLLHQVRLLRENPAILSDHQTRFHYILVDEYQDTNVVQYLWLRLLAQKHKNLCCVGDEDQSIYGWRGAEIGNILKFERDFPGAQVIRLEQNYRSTGHILAAASGVIAQNTLRIGKTLWTKADPGEHVEVRTFWDGEDEARGVAQSIEELHRNHGAPLGSVAVMVRAGFQTRAFEERFIALGLPYRVLVGARFYERQEVRDALAYIRLVFSATDDLAFERIVNRPKRGIGPTALTHLHVLARAKGLPLMEAAGVLTPEDAITPKARKTFAALHQDVARWRGLLGTTPHADVAKLVLEESGYMGLWQTDPSPEAPARLDNLKELLGAMAAFENLGAFLEHVSLVMEATENHDAQDQVSLMTLHGAKGLEFDYVFLPGWEEEIFPSRRALLENDLKGLEEERRLAYVGLTRARRKASVSHAQSRFLYGSWITPLPSRFIGELPPEHVRFRKSGRLG